MKKKLMIVFSVFVFVVINLIISNAFDKSSDLSLQSLENIAKADEESGVTDKCYNDFQFAYGSDDLRCGECCTYTNHIGFGTTGTCPDGYHFPC